MFTCFDLKSNLLALSSKGKHGKGYTLMNLASLVYVRAKVSLLEEESGATLSLGRA